MFAMTPMWESDLPSLINLWYLLAQWGLIILSQLLLKLKLYTRAASGGTGFAKAAGNYAAALYQLN